MSRLALAVVAAAIVLRADEVAAPRTLDIAEARISGTVNGIPMPADYAFTPGSPITLSFRIIGFTHKERSVSLTYSVEVVDCEGIAFDPPTQGRIAGRVYREFTKPVVVSSLIPAAPRSGEGRFRVNVYDELAKVAYRTEFAFLVESEQPAISEEFAILQPRLFRTQNEMGSAAPDLTFGPGSAVWCRFHLSGFGRGQNNQYDLSYGLTLRDSSGRVLLQEKQAVADRRDSFYPRWMLTGTVSLHLEKTIRPGDYVIQLRALDRVGRQEASATVPLAVR